MAFNFCKINPFKKDVDKAGEESVKTLWSPVWKAASIAVDKLTGINNTANSWLQNATVNWKYITALFSQLQSIASFVDAPLTKAELRLQLQDKLSRIMVTLNEQKSILWQDQTYVNAIYPWFDGLWKEIGNESAKPYRINEINTELQRMFNSNPIALLTHAPVNWEKSNLLKDLYLDTAEWDWSVWNNIFWDIESIPVSKNTKLAILEMLGKNYVKDLSNRTFFQNIVHNFVEWADKIRKVGTIAALWKHFWPLALIGAGVAPVIAAYAVMYVPNFYRAWRLKNRTFSFGSGWISGLRWKNNPARDFRHSLWITHALRFSDALSGIALDSVMFNSLYLDAATQMALEPYIDPRKTVEDNLVELEKRFNANPNEKNALILKIKDFYTQYSGIELYKDAETSLSAWGRWTNILGKFWVVQTKAAIKNLFYGRLTGEHVYALALESQDPNAYANYEAYHFGNRDVIWYYQELFYWLTWAMRLNRLSDDDDDDEKDQGFFADMLNAVIWWVSESGNIVPFLNFMQSSPRFRTIGSALNLLIANSGIYVNESEEERNRLAKLFWVDANDMRWAAFLKAVADDMLFKWIKFLQPLLQFWSARRYTDNAGAAFRDAYTSYFWGFINYMMQTNQFNEQLWSQTPIAAKWFLDMILWTRDNSYDLPFDVAKFADEGNQQKWLKWFMLDLTVAAKSSILWRMWRNWYVAITGKDQYWNPIEPSNAEWFKDAIFSDPSLSSYIKTADPKYLEWETLVYWYNRYAQLSLESMQAWDGKAYVDWKFASTYTRPDWTVVATDTDKLYDFFDNELSRKMGSGDYSKFKTAIQNAFDAWAGKDKYKAFQLAAAQDLATQYIAKESGGVNSQLIVWAMLEITKDAILKSQWHVNKYWYASTSWLIDWAKIEDAAKAEAFKQIVWPLARQINWEEWAWMIAYDTAVKNPELRTSIKNFKLEKMYWRADLNYEATDIKMDGMLLALDGISKDKFNAMWFANELAGRYYGLLNKYPEKTDQIKTATMDTLMLVKKELTDHWYPEEYAVNTIVPFLANNPDIHKAYMDNKDIPESDKEHTKKELYDLRDATNVMEQLPWMVKQYGWSGSWSYNWAWYSSSKKSSYGYRTYMDDVGDNLPFRTSYNKFNTWYDATLQRAFDNYAKEVYNDKKQTYSQQERKYLNARAYFKPAISRFPVDERFSPTTWWFQTYLKQQSKFKPAIWDELTLFPRLTKKTTGPQIGKSLQSTVRKSRVYNSNASSAARSR